MLYHIIGNDATRWTGQAIDGVNHPRNIGDLWTKQEREAIGLVKAETFAPPGSEPGKRAVRDEEPTKRDGVWGFGWSLVDIPPEEIDAARDVSVTKRVLALALMQREILTADDAVLVARGQWPTELEPYIATLPPEQVAVAEIEFAGSTEIERSHPTTQLFQQFFEISDEVADEIFGVVLP